ncbi:hypothetical protein [uncultured Jatrophihabitans sp.]|uniref:hypothetical protein n=1 Tax=uncultured Jatrophihabitans sp. TaxID=1610747 RepID=UPI0035CC1FEF
MDHAALLRAVAQASPAGEAEARWWREIGYVAVNAANLEWLMQRLLWCEAGLTPRTSPMVPDQFGEAALLAAQLVHTSVPPEYRTQLADWIDEAQDAIQARDALMRGAWIESPDATPQRVVATVADPSDGVEEQPSAEDAAAVNRQLRAAATRGITLFRVLAGVERRFAQAGFDQADAFRLVNPPASALLRA